ncbi:hypothetical protein BJY01DRAFT_240960 [Aspergillus pseudoustus]|uniref:NAD(P)-binding protein n=1 Tax=Aspergillus pseudoustus TaxID=1810923 RepID=A0ABR4IKK8_9EURO
MCARIALVTGCSPGGIGAALLAELKGLPYVTTLALDVTDRASIDAAVATVRRETGGKLDCLVNNSGVASIMPLIEADLDHGKDMFDVNVWGVLACTEAFVSMIIAAKGIVVNISSISGVLHSPYSGLYGTSKAAIITIGETLRLVLEPFGVRVLSVMTGAVSTNIVSKMTTAFQLSENSIYLPATQEIADRSWGEDFKGGIPADEYAAKIALDIKNGTTGKIWRAEQAGIVQFAKRFMPASIIDSMMRQKSGLEKLGQESYNSV